jgi:hypothetical protein
MARVGGGSEEGVGGWWVCKIRTTVHTLQLSPTQLYIFRVLQKSSSRRNIKRYLVFRTIIICSWDGEEHGLQGSTEWVEEFVKDLGEEAVAYINVYGLRKLFVDGDSAALKSGHADSN